MLKLGNGLPPPRNLGKFDLCQGGHFSVCMQQFYDSKDFEFWVTLHGDILHWHTAVFLWNLKKKIHFSIHCQLFLAVGTIESTNTFILFQESCSVVGKFSPSGGEAIKLS